MFLQTVSTISRYLSRFGTARNGNVALIFALMALPVIGAIGGAIDFSFATSNKTAFQDSADAAALAGAKAASAYISANGSGTSQITQAIALGNSAAQNFFAYNTGSIGGQSTPTVTVATTITSGAPTVILTASSNYTPFLLPIVGITSIPLSVTSTTTMTPSNSYYQIIFVVDVSGSMAIGGTSATISTMAGKGAFNQDPSQTGGVAVPCAFACHDSNDLEGFKATNWCDSNPADSNCRIYGDYYCPYGTGQCAMVNSQSMIDKRSLAKLWGYSLKIDYVNSAIQSFMSQLTNYNSKYPGRYTVGIDTFGTNFNVLQAPTTNMSTAAAAASAIDVESYPVLNGGYTYTTSGLTSALTNITNMGDGSSPTKMLTYVIFLTDAVEDIPNASAPDGRQTDVSYVSECTAMKNAGVNVFTIWSTYPAIPNDPTRYDVLVAPIASQLPTTLQSCASSPNQYFQANDGPGITAAVNSTFNTIVANSKLRITN